jgi:hypothetical protein
MTTAAQKALVPCLASIALIFASPHAIAGQSLSARPASVALTVVVPPHAPPRSGVTADGGATVISRTSTAVDLETRVGLGDRPTSRIEVRLGAAWNTDSARVWVRNRNGTFEQLLRNAMIVALDSPPTHSAAPSPLYFRVESTRPIALSSLAIPVEYRLTVGAGDEIAVWSFPTLIRFDASMNR